MTSREEFKIAIVGAGPAGTTLARLLQLAGFKQGERRSTSPFDVFIGLYISYAPAAYALGNSLVPFFPFFFG